MSYQKVKNEVRDILIYLFEFYKSPTKSIRKVPHWSWLSLFVLIFIFGAITGLARGVFSANLLTGLVGFIFLPLSSYVIVFALSALIYFLVVVFQDRNLNFKRLTTLVFITLIPSLTTYVFSLLHPVFVAIGITSSFILLLLGLQNRFQLNKYFLRLSLGIMYGLILVYLAFQYSGQYFENRKEQQLKEFQLENQKIIQEEMSK